jgi:prepilin-type N-terminal cleavage/methylation domain-containing protein
MSRKKNGFSFIEISIVLVITGLLLGGVLQGQELITSARVRHLVAQQDDIKAAYYGFLDRYRALPGDYIAASANIPNCGACENGNGNGQILTNGAVLESVAVWSHLSKAGFISGSYNYVAGDAAAAANTPVNSYGAMMQLIYDNNYSDLGASTNRHNLKTGNNLPSNLLAEIDRKVDDSRATAGHFRYSNFGSAAASAACTLASGVWISASPESNCGAVTML